MRVIAGGNAWNGSTDGLFCFNVNNSVGNVNTNNGAVAHWRNRIKYRFTYNTPCLGKNSCPIVLRYNKNLASSNKGNCEK